MSHVTPSTTILLSEALLETWGRRAWEEDQNEENDKVVRITEKKSNKSPDRFSSEVCPRLNFLLQNIFPNYLPALMSSFQLLAMENILKDIPF